MRGERIGVLKNAYFRSCLNALGAFGRFTDSRVLPRPLTPVYSAYPENIGLYYHHSEQTAVLPFSVRTQPFGAQRFFDGLCT